MKLKAFALTAAAAALTIGGTTTAAQADSCNDAYAAWKKEALKDGRLLSTIHTGKRAALYRATIDKMRKRWANIKGSDPACRSFLAWMAAETAKDRELTKGQKRIIADTEKSSTVQASGLLDSPDPKNFVNRPMYDKTGVYVGTVDDVVIVEGKPRYVAISRENFMGAEGDVYLVPLNVVRVTSRKDGFVIGTQADTFYGKYPRYKFSEWPKVKVKAETDASFQKQNDDYYKSISAFGQ